MIDPLHDETLRLTHLVTDLVLSLTAEGLTTGEVAARFADVYGAPWYPSDELD